MGSANNRTVVYGCSFTLVYYLQLLSVLIKFRNIQLCSSFYHICHGSVSTLGWHTWQTGSVCICLYYFYIWQPNKWELSGSTILFSYKVRNLGVYLDSNLSMDQHVNLLCRSVFLELRRIGRLRRLRSVDATKKLVSSFVLSRLDYCNSLLAGLPENRLDRLQRVQHNAARLVLGRWGRDHAKPLLRSLHWLPVRARIEYKISTMCYRSRDSSAPAYLSDFLYINLPALCVLQTLVSWLFHASNSTSMESVLSHTQDLWPGIPSPNLCVMLQVFPPSNPIWKRSSSESICTDDFHSQTHMGDEQSWQFSVYLYILCSACARMIVLICCCIFTVLLRYLKNLQCLGCY